LGEQISQRIHIVYGNEIIHNIWYLFFASHVYQDSDVKDTNTQRRLWCQKAMLIYLLYPSSSVDLPLQPNIRKSPKLQILDTGMLNYFARFQKDLSGTRDIDSIYYGKITEHIVG